MIPKDHRRVVDHDTITKTLTCAWNAKQITALPSPRPFRDPGQKASLSARSVFGIRPQIPDSSAPARVPACQGIPTQRGSARLPPLASGHADFRLNRSSRPGDRSVSRARRLYRIPGALSRARPRTEVPLPEARIFPSRSACRREKRTLTCPSGTQRVSRINTTMSSAWSVAFPLQVAAARWPRWQLNEYTTRQILCQVNPLIRFSRARSLSLPAPAGLTRRLNCALRGCELYGAWGVRARVTEGNWVSAWDRGSSPSSKAGRGAPRSPRSSPHSCCR